MRGEPGSFSLRLGRWIGFAAGAPIAFAAVLTWRAVEAHMWRTVTEEVTAMRLVATGAATQALRDREGLLRTAQGAPRLVDRDPAAKQAALDLFRSHNPAWLWIAVADPAGRVQAASPPRPGDLAQDVAFRRGLRDFTVSEPAASPGRRVPVLRYAGPLYRPEGHLVGVVICDVEVHAFQDLFRRARIRQTGETYLVRADGSFVTHPRLGDRRGHVASQGFQEALAGRSGLATYVDYRGVPVVGAYAPFPVSDLPGAPTWVILSEIDEAEALAPLRDVERIIGWTTLLMLILVAGTAWLGSRRVTRPLRDLSTAAAGIAAGDWRQRVAYSSDDEFGTLARAFNQMAEQVENTLTALTALDRFRREFIDAISHDLRSPLTSVIGYAELLLEGIDGPLSKEQEASVRQIMKGARRVEALVEDLLDLARVEAGELRLTCARADLADTVRTVAASLRPQLEDAGVALDLSLPEGAGEAAIDAGRMERVVANLLSNAIKFTPAGGHIRMGLRRQDGVVEAEVADTGPGIAPADVPRLFERFAQLEAGRARKGGTGLGLSIVKAIVEAHGGQVGVRSEPGAGATFWFRIPVDGPQG